MPEEKEGQQTETSELVELVNGVIPEGKMVVVIGGIVDITVYPEASIGEPPSEALRKRLSISKIGLSNHYMKHLVGSANGYVTYAVQFIRLKDNPDYAGRLRKIDEEIGFKMNTNEAIIDGCSSACGKKASIRLEAETRKETLENVRRYIRNKFPEIDFEGK